MVNPDIPQEEIDSFLAGTSSLSDSSMALLSGIYTIESGKNEFGGQAVVKYTGRSISFYFKKNTAFMITQAGQIDSVIKIAGYWRYAEGSEAGLITMTIDKENGSREILNGKKPQNLTMTGIYHSEGQKTFTISYAKELKTEDFMIIGHRGGGRNIDRLPCSENSVNMLLYAERLGCNGVEIDVRLTKDNVPVLFHDEYMSKRLIKEDFFIGKISDYTFDVLRTYCTLKKGERIPSLREALDAILYQTELKFVWLDIKAASFLKIIAPIQKEYLEKAALAGRQLEIFIGLPDEDIIYEYLKLPDYQSYPALCELDESYVEKTSAAIWAPRWSLGLLTERVAAMHQKGKRVFIWTLDEPEFIETYIKKGIFDGILTNYPATLSFEYFSNE